MILRKVAVVVGAISVVLGIASCKGGGGSTAKCCSFTYVDPVTYIAYAYYGCEGGNLFIDGYDYGPIPSSYWPAFEAAAVFYGGSCS